MSVAFLLASFIHIIKNGIKSLKYKLFNLKLFDNTFYYLEKIKAYVTLFFIFLFLILLITGPFIIGPYLRSNEKRAPHPVLLKLKEQQQEIDSIHNEIERSLESIIIGIDTMKYDTLNKIHGK
jgi:hypothetical protein